MGGDQESTAGMEIALYRVAATIQELSAPDRRSPPC